VGDDDDRVTVIRRGKKIATLDAAGQSEEELARLMVGREVVLRVDKEPAKPGKVVLEVKNLHAKNDRGIEAVRDVSFTVRAGEIVGIAGVDGNGQSELVACLTGLRKPTSGTILVNGQDVTGQSPRRIRDAGVGHIPEDRQRRGLVLNFTVAENAALGDHRAYARRGWLSYPRMIQAAQHIINNFDVRPPRHDYLARSLSGGNQQKVIVGREISRNPELMIAVQPTRGLDVGAIEFIHKNLVAERDAGRAILLVSLELDEIMNLADRILVMYKGQVVAEVAGHEATEEGLGLLMMGGSVSA